MAKAKKKAKKKGRSNAEIALLKVINAAKDVNSQVLECGSAMANDCHELDNIIWDISREFKFKPADSNNWHSHWV
jgi:hypothetical protein